MCRASCDRYFFLGCLTVTVRVIVLAVPPVGVYVIFSVTLSRLSLRSALLAFDDSAIVIVCAPALATVTVLAASLIALPFLGLVEDAMLSLPAPGSCSDEADRGAADARRGDRDDVARRGGGGGRRGGAAAGVGVGVGVGSGRSRLRVVHGRPWPPLFQPIASTPALAIVEDRRRQRVVVRARQAVTASPVPAWP